MKDLDTKQLIDDISELDNRCYNEMPLSILIETSLNDDGERYFDCTIFSGKVSSVEVRRFDDKTQPLVDVIGAESLSELFKELVKEWNK